MRKNSIVVAFGLFLACAGFAFANYSSSSCPIGNEHITLDLKDAAVADIFGFMGDLTGLQFVLDECVEGWVTLKLENTPVETALGAILNSLDLECYMTGNVCEIRCKRTLKEAPEQDEMYRKFRIRMKLRLEEIGPKGEREVAARVSCETMAGSSCSMRKGSMIHFEDMDGEGNIFMRMGNGGFTVEIVPFIEDEQTARLHALTTLVERDEEHDTLIKSSRVVETSAHVGAGSGLLTYIPSTKGGGVEIYLSLEEIIPGAVH